MQTRKIVVFMMLALALVLGTAVVHALNTPDWWDNPNGYSSHTQYVYQGTASTLGDPNAQTIVVRADQQTCHVGNVGSKEVWVQIEWIVVEGSGLLETGGNTRTISWTDSPSACPASPSQPLPDYNEDAIKFLTRRGVMEGGPEHIPGANTEERSANLSPADDGDSFPSTCERIETQFSLEPNSQVDYRIEVQTVCFSPTAVSLQSFTSVSSNLPAVGLVGMLALVIVSFGIAVVRRERRA